MPIPKISEVPHAAKLSYVSDVEGHWQYFCNFVELNKHILCKDANGGRDSRTALDLELEGEDTYFVFGGDACDKGPGTLRFLQTMVNLKHKYPSRVFLVLGNRDINKMRWTAELADSEVERLTTGAVPPCFWVSKANAPLDYIKSIAADAEKVAQEDLTEDMVRKYCTKANLYRYHLKFDAGSDGEFEFRRQELAHMQARRSEEVSDDEVVASYDEQGAEGGLMREYLQLGQLGVILGSTLIVHGSLVDNTPQMLRRLNREDQGFVPIVNCVPIVPDDGTGPYEIENDVRQWLTRLNSWGYNMVEEWIASPTWSSPPTDSSYAQWLQRGGAALIAYGSGTPYAPSVVYSRYLSPLCMPLQYPVDVVNQLTSQGIKAVVVGHTPHGNAPTLIPHGNNFILLMGDTSFSDMKGDKAFAGDNRGNAVCDMSCNGEQWHIRGRTQNDRLIDYQVGSVGGDPFIGQMEQLPETTPDADRHFVKAFLPEFPRFDRSKDAYLWCSIHGFRYEYTELSAAETQTLLASCKQLERNDSTHSMIHCCGRTFGHGFGENDDTIHLDYIWNVLDANRDGFCSKSELMAACSQEEIRDALALAFPNLNIQSVFETLDANADSSISKDEFFEYFSAAMDRCGGRQRLDLFKALDTLKSGLISDARFEEILVNIGILKERCPQIFRKVDLNKDGTIDCTEFCKWLGDSAEDDIGHEACQKLVNYSQTDFASDQNV
eukprot:gb/GFBE01049722.1/.p1 GENE.gb/GFBE01049722.1/~~gb/GFBE01049722.1/.p1  ORF type:complete len:720 (+),score=109.54 gb/GFBE01049722.1/:1-2160(+)